MQTIRTDDVGVSPRFDVRAAWEFDRCLAEARRGRLARLWLRLAALWLLLLALAFSAAGCVGMGQQAKSETKAVADAALDGAQVFCLVAQAAAPLFTADPAAVAAAMAACKVDQAFAPAAKAILDNELGKKAGCRK